MLKRLKHFLFPPPKMTVLSAIGELFSRHDVETKESDGWLLGGEDYPKISASLAHVTQRAHDVFTQLDVSVAIDDRSVIVECFSDSGATSDEAIANSLFNFSSSSLHVLLSGIWNLPQGEQVCVETWETQGRVWNAHVGPTVRKRSTDGADVLPAKDLELTLQRLLAERHLAPEIHWVRLFYANIGADDRPITEVLFDNDPWEEAQSKIASLDWPDRDYFYSARIFILLEPKELE